LMTVIMVIAAGSKLDSTFASLSKLGGKDLAELACGHDRYGRVCDFWQYSDVLWK